MNNTTTTRSFLLRWFLAAVSAVVVLSVSLGCGGNRQAPVVVIGLDGADFDLLIPWIEAGELPNLARFFDEAAVGELTTVYPILSPVCWTSAITGVNPGKHGIYDFQKPDPQGGPDPIIETATHRRAQPIWMLLSEAKHRVGVMNVPMTYPPDPVRGKMVSGFPFPGGDVNIAYPPEYNEELVDYPLDFLGETLFKRTPDEMFADFKKGQTARANLALEWIDSGSFDFLWVVFTAPDKVQHFFWKFMDPQHPKHDPELAKIYSNHILDLWKQQDAELGKLFAALPPDATVMLLSDHGFEGIYRQVNMANWLPNTEVPSWLATLAIPPLSVTNGILHYEIEGQLPGSSDREEFLDRFIDLCGSLRDPENNQSPMESVFRREDIYSGRMLEKAPDVIIQEAPHYFVTRGVPDSSDVPVFQDVWTTSFSAHHRPEGILAIRGPNVCGSGTGSLRERISQGGEFKRAHIMDVAPTLLTLMNQPIPDDMDGRVLEEAVCTEFLSVNPPRIVPIEGFLLDRAPPSKLTQEERDLMKALPYIQ